MELKKLTLNKILVVTGAVALILVIVFWFWWGDKEISINNKGTGSVIKDNRPLSSISGLPCDNHNRRPISVMLSSDMETRPLSGISEADIVFEMPVTPGGVTRTMAIFQCFDPGEIGSVRSAREDFIPLAASLGTVYAHWGGEREALKKLDNHVLDNIDAMKYETVYFYRKAGIKQPHNGFTSFNKLWQAINDLKYEDRNTFAGYPHTDKKPSKNINNLTDRISTNYPFPFNVTWVYDQENDIYKRIRGGSFEIDRNNNIEVIASVVVVMKTTSKFVSKDYMNMNVTGEGEVEIYQNGIKIIGKWQKEQELASKIFFYDVNGEEIEFAPGKIWVEIVVN